MLVSLLPTARRILSETDTPERRAGEDRVWIEGPTAALTEFLQTESAKHARGVADEVGYMSNPPRLRADRAIAFAGRRDLQAEAEDMVMEFWSIVSLRAIRFSEVGGFASMAIRHASMPCAFYALGWAKHARQAAAAIDDMLTFGQTLEKREIIPDSTTFEMHPIGWLEVLANGMLSSSRSRSGRGAMRPRWSSTRTLPPAGTALIQRILKTPFLRPATPMSGIAPPSTTERMARPSCPNDCGLTVWKRSCAGVWNWGSTSRSLTTWSLPLRHRAICARSHRCRTCHPSSPTPCIFWIE